ncbi:tetratricopeptide repeat protein [Hamadaea tsunoensis]|uniref:tetratricopeptide repeat protein n=1 Tax=Hamadaea tsunoensis TaxID=53368 RepID=UPI00068692C7|nr:tetratricopeptide repeat protein [Hamadaea tsunoensis]
MVLVGRRKAGAVEHPPFDCHRDHGPYAGVDSFLTTLAHDRPRLAAAHAVELAAIAPGLDPSPRRAAEEQPIRFHPARRTAALAYGAAEFVHAWAAGLRTPVTVHFVHTADADETTAELLAALGRRLADGPLRLALHTDGPPTPVPAVRPEELRAALGDSLARGFYHHAARVARRGRAITHDPGLRWSFTTGLATALAALDQASEALQLYAETRTTTTDPKILMSAAYATAMLYARHLPPAEQDQGAARDWLGRAIRLAADLPDPRQRVLTTVFYEQGVALLDSREGRPDRALATIDSGLSALAAVLSPGERPQDWARLLHNRAQVHLALGDRQRALAGLDEVIERDPGNCEYYADRAALHRAAGRDRDAFDDYAAAIRLGPHLPEAYYNRATLHDEHGRPGKAREDLRRVLAIDPRHVDARIALANLDLGRAALDDAEAGVRAGLAVSPDEPQLLCTLGLIRSERGDLAGADDLLTRALSADPGLAEAWTNRAAVRFEQGDPAAALADLDHAIALSAAPEPLFNRATALLRLGRYAEAEADLTAALALPDLDAGLRKEIRAELARARTAATAPVGG